jgi:hypothetical protein
MNKKFTSISGMTLLAISVVAVGVFSAEEKTNLVNGTSTSYSFILNANRKLNDVSGNEQTGTLKTDGGGDLTFKYSNVAALANGFGTIAAGGYVYNVGATPITGITSIVLTFGEGTPNITLAVGSMTVFSPVETFSITSGTSYTYTAPTDVDIRYFKIAALADTQISNIAISYSCVQGQRHFYIGEYPQTVVEDASLSSAIATNGVLGTDGYYSYNGKKYALQTSNKYYKSVSTNLTFSEGSPYYFEVEPVEWIVITDTNSTTCLLLSKYVLSAYSFFDGSSSTRNIDKKLSMQITTSIRKLGHILMDMMDLVIPLAISMGWDL